MKKNISYRSSELLNSLIETKMDFFTSEDAQKILPDNDPNAVKQLLSNMAKRGLIMRIKPGLYHLIPYEQNPENYFPDWHRTAEAIAGPKEYYIAFYSALQLHGLITQPSLTEQAVTTEQIKPATLQVKNVRFQFITLTPSRFFGYKKHWIDDFHKVYCSDLEKTFIDCLYMPEYAGGITEITKAMYKSREKLQPEKFRKYLEKFDTQAVYKRLGFLLERLDLFPELRNFISGKLTASYIPLDPSAPKEGHHYAKWRILDNINFQSALDSLQT